MKGEYWSEVKGKKAACAEVKGNLWGRVWRKRRARA